MEVYHCTCVCTDSFNELIQQSVCLRNLRLEPAELVGKSIIPLLKPLPPCFFRRHCRCPFRFRSLCHFGGGFCGLPHILAVIVFLVCHRYVLYLLRPDFIFFPICAAAARAHLRARSISSSFFVTPVIAIA